MSPQPRIVLLCHADEPFDREGLSAWLAGVANLAGIIVISGSRGRRWRAVVREWRRRGLIALCDVLAFRAWYALRYGARDRVWTRAAINRLRLHGGDVSGVPTVIVQDPNGAGACAFLDRTAPDLVVARCKQLLTPRVFERPRAGVVVLHPGICPEYRNAHGCFWALVNRDLARVGLTVLRIDRGIDTGPIYFQASCDVDEDQESHIVIQQRVVIEHLREIADVLAGIADGTAAPIATLGRRSAVWGQPTFTAYLRWQRAMRHLRRATRESTAS